MSTGRSPEAVLQVWRLDVTARTRSLILPDGCRDLILKFSPQGVVHRFVSPLHDTAEAVESGAGDRYVGYRFHPAAVFDEATLLKATHSGEAGETAALAAIGDQVRIDGRLAEALDTLAEAPGVAAARRRLGVSERALERLVTTATGRTPACWRGLARVRKAAAALAGSDTLTLVAADQGYADQAHMSRDFRRWFGLSPSRLRGSPALLSIATASGYGAAATGVQSSTRKPSRSAT